MNETLWKHREKKWKPRNKQAALVIRKANELLLHTPPQESKREPTLAEKLAAESEVRQARIAAIEAEQAARQQRRAVQKAATAKPPKVAKAKNMWAARLLRQQRKSRGLPPPTTEELRAFRKSQPGYGQPLYHAGSK